MNEVALINPKKEDSSEVIIFDIALLKKMKTILSSKRPFVPLSVQFSESGEKLFIGYHIGTSKGGFYVINVQQNKKEKDILVGKELPIHFWERSNQLFISTEYGKTVCYDSNYLKLWEKNVGLSSINQTGKFGLQINCYYDNITKFTCFNTVAKTSIVLDDKLVLQPKFNPTGTKVIAISIKNNSDPLEINSKKVSAVIFDFNIE
jgi:hypothetical protein